MKRVNMFLITVIASIASIILLTVIGFTIFTSGQAQQHPNDWMSHMWSSDGITGQSGHMASTQASSTSSLLPYFGIGFAVLIGLTVVGLVGLGYYIVYPQMKIGIIQPVAPNRSASNTSAYASVSKTLTDEERKVIGVLSAHDGKYLQKYIRNETGLSRLKTHRILARLADRGVVSLEKVGNTNQVYLADWLHKNA